MSRRDLLDLSVEALEAWTSRGLVRRAEKAAESVDLDCPEGGVIRAKFPDGAQAALSARDSIEQSRCTCGSRGPCRHRIALVLAYQHRHRVEFRSWSPGEFTDEQLAGRFGDGVLEAARQACAAGFPAVVRRPEPGRVAEVELSACTVRFLVAGDLDHASADAVEGAVPIVLAVWAFRAAEGIPGEIVHLDVGGPEPSATGLESIVDTVRGLLLDGVTRTGPVRVAGLRRAQAELTAWEQRWPAAAVAELVEQLDAYRCRAAHYRPERFGDLLTELVARHRAAASGVSPRSRVLGTGEPAETALRRVRLTGLGCRISRDAERCLAEVYFAHSAAGVVLVLRKSVPIPPGGRLVGANLAATRVAGSTVRALAGANVVSESATRVAGQEVRLSSTRLGRTTTTPLGNAWSGLPDTLAVRDFAACLAGLRSLPPRYVRPRVAAELVRAVRMHEVVRIGYHPGDQRLDAVITDTAGTKAVVSAHYDPACPGALERLAGALASGPRWLSGSLSAAGGRLVINPIAVLGADGLVLPDLAADVGDTPFPLAEPPPPTVLAEAVAQLDESAHRGLRHSTPAAMRHCAASLTEQGLLTCAQRVVELAEALTSGDTERMADAWFAARLRLVLCAEAADQPGAAEPEVACPV